MNLCFGPVVLKAGTNGFSSLESASADRKSLSAPHPCSDFWLVSVQQGRLISAAGAEGISPPHAGYSGGLRHCSCKTSADLDCSGNGREEITNLSYWRAPTPVLLHGESRLLSALFMRLFKGQVSALVYGCRNFLSASLQRVGSRCSPVLGISYELTLHSDMLTSGVQSTLLFLAILWVWGRGRWLVGLMAFCCRAPLVRWEQPCPFPWSCCDCGQGLWNPPVPLKLNTVYQSTFRGLLWIWDVKCPRKPFCPGEWNPLAY